MKHKHHLWLELKESESMQMTGIDWFPLKPLKSISNTRPLQPAETAIQLNTYGSIVRQSESREFRSVVLPVFIVELP